MARIPMGNFGSVMPQVQASQVQVPNMGAVSQAVGNLAETGMRIGAQLQHEQEQDADGLARAKAANAQLDYELQVSTVSKQFEDDIATGAMPYQEAAGRYQDAVGKLEVPKIDGLKPDMQLAYDRGIKRTQMGATAGIDRVVRTAQRADFKGQFDGALDKLGKISGMPGADIGAVIERAKSFAPLAQQAGLDSAVISKKLQDFADTAWTTQATQRSIYARDDMGQLDKLEHDLTAQDGYYADKLDPQKRNALLSQVQTRRETLINRAERAQDHADAKAQRVLDAIDRQIASGVPATAEMWSNWSDTVKASSPDLRQQFNERVGDEKEVQDVLRMPADQQASYLQKAEAELLTKGGSVTRKTNLDRTKAAIEAAGKQLQDAPLLFNASREGGDVEPLKVQALADPTSAWEVGAQLQQRAATIDAMRKRYGQQVPMNVLLPQEVKLFGDALKQGTSADQANMLSQLRMSVTDDGIFNSVMKQVAPTEPVMAYAGMLATRERAAVTLEKHWLSPNVSVGGRDVAQTMLEGNRLLQGKGDSKFPLPPEKEFRDAFTSATGNLFAGRPGAADVAMQAVRAYYTGQSSADGDHSGAVDGKRLRQAITASLGEVVDVNGHGDVLVPWGMGSDKFEAEAEQQFTVAARAAGLPDQVANDFNAYGLRQASERTFYVTRGRTFLTGKDGKPVTITITGSGR